MLLSLAAAGLGAAGCGNAVTGKITARSAGQPAHWTAFAIADRPLDIAGPRRDGSVVLAAGGRLWLLSPSGSRTAFAPGYRSPGGEEPYIALSPGGCYGAGTLYALHLTGGRVKRPSAKNISCGVSRRRKTAGATADPTD